ncbi:unnamed protein product [Mycena citricolor]|uniref:Velvet domain-containing protein n=1 Tax=Mycena citricolor TaxID=2018698 RepID=A0AAD2H766_9AGAR|nr:unnamed protein product [Mycena citricolor]
MAPSSSSRLALTDDGLRYRKYELTMRQEPKQARMCGIGGKADRRPIDPPVIVQLRVIDTAAPPPPPTPSPSSPSTPDAEPPYHNLASYASNFLNNPYYFMFASLAKPDEDEELHWLKDGKTRYTTGSIVSSLYSLKDPSLVPDGDDSDGQGGDVGFFVFPDLSVRTEGSYRLKLSLYEVVGNDVQHCKSIFSAPFFVYTAKKFPGVEDQGIKIRIRKDIRMRKTRAGLAQGISELETFGSPGPNAARGGGLIGPPPDEAGDMPTVDPDPPLDDEGESHRPTKRSRTEELSANSTGVPPVGAPWPSVIPPPPGAQIQGPLPIQQPQVPAVIPPPPVGSAEPAPPSLYEPRPPAVSYEQYNQPIRHIPPPAPYNQPPGPPVYRPEQSTPGPPPGGHPYPPQYGQQPQPPPPPQPQPPQPYYYPPPWADPYGGQYAAPPVHGYYGPPAPAPAPTAPPPPQYGAPAPYYNEYAPGYQNQQQQVSPPPQASNSLRPPPIPVAPPPQYGYRPYPPGFYGYPQQQQQQQQQQPQHEAHAWGTPPSFVPPPAQPQPWGTPGEYPAPSQIPPPPGAHIVSPTTGLPGPNPPVPITPQRVGVRREQHPGKKNPLSIGSIISDE